MPRPQINFALPQQGLRPAAAPVDTFYQPNLVPPEEAVGNAWLEVAKGLSALSPSMTGFIQEMEKQKRKKMPSEAEVAVAQFKGDASVLRELPSMTPEEAQQWFEANKGAFGDYELNYASRPDFVLQFQAYAGRRNVLEDKRFPGADGQQVTAQDYIYSRMDEFSDPEADRQALMQEVREALFEGVDPNKGTAFREGVLDAWVPIETQFMQITGAKQQAARAGEVKRQVTTEVYEAFHTQFAKRHSDTPLTPEDEELFLGLLQNITGPYKQKGGEDTNTLVSKAIEMVADEVQRDSDDGLEAVDFLEWVGNQAVFTKGKPLNADPFWKKVLGDIEDRVELKARQLGRDEKDASLNEIRYRMPGLVRNQLRESGAATTEDALRVLLQPENRGLFENLLKENGLSVDNAQSLIEEVAEDFISSQSSGLRELTAEGREIEADLNRRIMTEGATDELHARLEDFQTQAALGGTAPGGRWDQLWTRFDEAKKAGVRTPQFREQADQVVELLVPSSERNLYPPGEQAQLGLIQLQMKRDFESRLLSEPDPKKREELLITLPAQLALEYRSRSDVQELLSSTYASSPGILLGSFSNYTSGLQSVLRVRYPDQERIETASGETQWIQRPGNVTARIDAEAELMRLSEENVLRLLDHYSDVTDLRRRKDLIQQGLLSGNVDAGVPRFSVMLDRYFAGLAVTDAQPNQEVSGAPTTPQVRASEQQFQKTRQAPEVNDLVDLGMRAPAGWSDAHRQFAQSQQIAMMSLPGTETFREAQRDVHDPREGLVYREQARPLFMITSLPSSTRDALARTSPSSNQLERMFAAHLLANPGELHSDPWFSTAVEDVGVEFNNYAEQPEVLKALLRGTVVHSGLSFAELEAGKLREGLQLSDVLGAPSEWPVGIMHFGPNDPDEFAQAFSEWTSKETRANSRYQKLMEQLGVLPDQPISETDSRTHGEAFMSNLSKRYNARREALGDDVMRSIHAPYSTFKDKSLEDGPALKWAQQQEQDFLGGDR